MTDGDSYMPRKTNLSLPQSDLQGSFLSFLTTPKPFPTTLDLYRGGGQTLVSLLISGLPSFPLHSRTILVPVSEVASQVIPPQIFAIDHCMCSSIQLTSSISFIHRSIPSKDQRLVMSYTKRIPWWKKIRSNQEVS